MFLRKPFYIVIAIICTIAVIGVWFPILTKMDYACLMLFTLVVLIDAVMLLWCKVEGKRRISTKLDLGETNHVHTEMNILRGRLTGCTLIDELPPEFSKETEKTKMQYHSTNGKASYIADYTAFPTQRGCYTLGRLIVFVRFIGLLERRMTIVQMGDKVDIYPSFSHLREKEQQARLVQTFVGGVHKHQRPSNQTEFQDIREYAIGDDIRAINWKATARTGRTMVNNYEDERSQHIFNIIDCCSTMHRTFDRLTLQDYAINASLLLSYSALHTEGDCVGLATYGPSGTSYLPARAGDLQLQTIMNQLYSLKTEYGASDLEELCLLLDHRVMRRSLVMIYTDYATLSSMERQLPLLKRIATRHLLVLVNFVDEELQNTANRTLHPKDKHSTHEYITRSLATDLTLQKLLIAEKLQQNGILSIMVRPKDVSFTVVRKYLELKSRGAW